MQGEPTARLYVDSIQLVRQGKKKELCMEWQKGIPKVRMKKTTKYRNTEGRKVHFHSRCLRQNITSLQSLMVWVKDVWSQDTAAPCCQQLPANLLLSIVSHQTKTALTQTHTRIRCVNLRHFVAMFGVCAAILLLLYAYFSKTWTLQCYPYWSRYLDCLMVFGTEPSTCE